MQKSSVIRLIQPPQLYDSLPYAYSHIAAIKVEEISEIIHISGQGGENQSNHLSVHFEQQAEQVFLNLEHALDHCELTWNNVAKLTLLIVDHSPIKHKILIELMQHYFTTQNFPACTLIPVPCLALKDMQIEIDAIAYRFK